MATDGGKYTSPFWTGGGGSAFEYEAAAYFMLCLLTGHEPWNGDGRIERLAFQQSRYGWEPDDLLLILKDGEGLRSCPVSVKSYPALASGGFEDQRGKSSDKKTGGLLAATWRHHLGQTTTDPPFDAGRDLVGLACRDVILAVAEDWQRVLAAASDAIATGRSVLVLSDSASALYQGLACPSSVDCRGADPARLQPSVVRSLRVLDLAQQATQVELLCKDVVRSGQKEDAQALWHSLCALASEWDPAGRDVDLPLLLRRLRQAGFSLREYPDHRADWTALGELSDLAIDRVVDTIGNVRLDTSSFSQGIDRRLVEEHRLGAVLVGQSGAGKTVAAKRWAVARRDAGESLVWFEPADLNGRSREEFLHRPGLQHRLDELMTAAPGPGWLVVDGVDRLTPTQGMSRLADLLSLAGVGRDEVERDSPWRVVMTSETAAWDSVRTGLEKLGIAIGLLAPVVVGPRSEDDLQPIVQAHPGLAAALHGKLAPVLRRPKYLADVVRQLDRGGDLPERAWVGETELVDWLWDGHLEAAGPAARAAVLRLGCQLGDKLQPTVPLAALDVADADALQPLCERGFCARLQDSLGFAHDLHADWARYRHLVSMAEEWARYLADRLSSPLWQKAVRMLGQRALEQGNGIEPWLALLRAARDASLGGLAERCLLEALALAGNAADSLEAAWPTLAADGGAALRRFLEIFRDVATQPDEVTVRLFVEHLGASATEVSAVARIPDALLWPPVLEVLCRHPEDVISMARKELAPLAQQWLRVNWHGLPWQAELAAMAIAAAEHQAEFKDDPSPMGKLEESPAAQIYRAAIQAAQYDPERVLRFCRQRARLDPIRNEPPAEEYWSEPFTHRQVTIPPPWPGGPRRRVDSVFQAICLGRVPAVFPLQSIRPEEARQVLYALLIAAPRPRSDLVYTELYEDLDLEDLPDTRAAFHDAGPFGLFLSTAPEQGLRLVVDLVNFATDRHVEAHPSEGVDVGEWGHWSGDATVYMWHRAARHAVAMESALMAVEHWLYEQLDEGQDIDQWVAQIADSSHSVAFAALLVSVAKRQPALLQGPLRPLMAAWQFSVWDVQQLVQVEGSRHPALVLPFVLLTEGQKTAQQIRRWHILEHRQLRFDMLVQQALFSDTEVAAYLERVRAQWRSQLDEMGDHHPLRWRLQQRLVQHDPANWVEEDHPDHGRVLTLQLPDDLQQQLDAEAAATQPGALTAILGSQFRTALNEEDRLSAERADGIWHQLCQIETDSRFEDHPDCPTRRVDVLCGGAAVLLRLGREWLDSCPEAAEWCRRLIVETPLAPPPPGPWDSAEQVWDEGWDCFCAETLPLLLAAEPTDRRTRQAAALVALSYHYRTSAFLLRRAWESRDDLGPDFGRLQVLVLRFARARWQWQRELEQRRRDEVWVEGWPEPHDRWWRMRRCGRRLRLACGLGPRRHRRFSLRGWAAKHVRLFVDGRLPTHAPRLEEMSVWQPVPETDGRDQRPRDPGIDLGQLVYAYAWRPRLKDAQSAEERHATIEFWQEVVEWFCARLAAPDDHRIRSDLESFDEWALEELATVVLAAIPFEGQRLWQPLLALGAPAEYWVGRYLDNVLAIGRIDGASRTALIQVWRSMVDFCLDRREVQQRFGDCWSHLLGLADFSVILWQAEDAPTIDAMRERYARWGQAYLSQSRWYDAFVRFLRGPQAAAIRDDGLTWLASAGVVTKRPTDLATVLQLAWGSWSGHFPNAQVRTAFLKLLGDVEGEPLARRLREELGG